MNSRYVTGLFSFVILFSLISCNLSSSVPNSVGPEIEQLVKTNKTIPEYENKKILRLWSFHTGDEFDFMQSLAVQYQKLHPDIQIKVEYIPSHEYFSGNKLMTAIASGEGPDLFFVSSSTIRKYVDAKILKPLTIEFTPQMKADFYESELDAVTFQDEIYAIPFEVELLGLFYNKQMFAEKNIKPPRTWSEMIRAAEKLRTTQVSGLTIDLDGDVFQNFSWLPFFWQKNVRFYDESTGQTDLQQPEAQEVYAFFQQMRDKQLLNLHPSRSATDIGILVNEETAMQVTGTWNIASLEKNHANVPIDVVPLPTPEEGTPSTIAGGWKLAVNQFSDHISEATQFAMWAFAEDLSHPLEWCTKVKFAYSPRKSVMLAGKSSFHKGLRRVFTQEIMETKRSEPRYPDAINQILTDSIQNIILQRLSVQIVLEHARKRIVPYMKTVSEK